MTKGSEVAGISTQGILGEGGVDGSKMAAVLQKEGGKDEKKEASEEEDEKEMEAAPIRSPKNPADPTPTEREEHNATHRIFRPWCPV